MLNFKRTMGFSPGRGTTVPNNRVPILRGCHKVGFDFTQIGPCHEIVSILYVFV